MAAIFHLALVWSALMGLGHGQCRLANWWLSFDNIGLSKCDSMHEYIKGFQRNNNGGASDYILLLEEAECCKRLNPWQWSRPKTLYADWWVTFDHNNRWNSCPTGYFLNGLYRNGNHQGWLYHIEEGRCTRPADHPDSYGHCYDEDITLCFDNNNICKCNDNYFVTGLYRGNCHSLYCLEKLRCCKMRNLKEQLNSVAEVKTRVMDTTMYDYALLAHYLGYSWCSGCRAAYVGEDFTRNGDTWQAVKGGPYSRCSGYKNDQRLNMVYGHWSFDIKSISFGNPVIQELQPQTIDSGNVTNNSPTETTETIQRTEESVRSVTHTTTTSWSRAHELGVELTYTPPDTGGFGVSSSYTFSYETSSSTTDSTGSQQTSTFQRTSEKTVPPYTQTRWDLILSKTRRTISYTATVIARFSVEFQGFLRWGGSANSISTNYHRDHRGSSSRPTFHYRFGDSNIPFYTAVKQQSDVSSYPWLWNDMKNAYSGAANHINYICNENRYVFQLQGKFEDVIGTQADIRWTDNQPIGRKRSASLRNETISSEKVKHLTHVAEAGPNDLPAPDIDPPVVDIDIPLGVDTEPELVLGG